MTKRLLISYLVLASSLLSMTAVIAQPVYKWTDTDGKVRYSDSPPPEGSTVSTVDIAPGPTEAQRQQADTLLKQQTESAENYKAKRDAEKAAAIEAKKQQPRVEPTPQQEEEKEDDGSRNARRCERGDIGWPCTPPITNPIYPPKPGFPGKPVRPLPKPEPLPGRPVTLPAKTSL